MHFRTSPQAGDSRSKAQATLNSAGHEDASTQKAAATPDTGQDGAPAAKKAYGAAT